jgi:hypothetical protein
VYRDKRKGQHKKTMAHKNTVTSQKATERKNIIKGCKTMFMQQAFQTITKHQQA